MPRLERKTQQIFCNSADSDQLAVFGSMATGTPVYSNDIEELQSNEAYQVGWDAATLEDKAPFMEEMNGLQYGITRQLAYLLQQGISEWDAGTTYYIGNFVAQNSRLYISLTDNNIGNSPIDSADNWQEFSSGGGLEIGDIGIAPLGIDETKGLRRYLNGQLIIQEQYVQFTNKVKSAIALYPTLGCTEDEWQATALLTVGGQVGKFVVDDDAGTIRLPKIIMPIQGLTDLSKLAEIVEAGLPNIEGSFGGACGGGTFSGAFTQGSKVGTIASGGGSHYDVSFDASLSNPIYGNSDTVQQEQIQYPYFIQVATGAETEDNIINEIELNNPYTLFDSKYSPNALYNVSWLKSEGQYNNGADYVTCYEGLLVEYNTEIEVGTTTTLPSGTEYTKKGLSVALSTDEYTDYDFVVNTAEETFRLPLLDGSEDLPSNKKNSFTLKASESTYIAPANGWYQVVKTASSASQHLQIHNLTTSLWSNLTAENGTNVLRVKLYANRGDEVQINYTVTGTTWSSNFIYAQGNGSLYYYVGETVQNANLINAGRIEEKIADFIPHNRTVWDGQWVESRYQLSSTTTVGTYSYDLSEYLPNDGYTYEVLLKCLVVQNTNGTNTNCYAGSDVITDKFVQVASDNNLGGITITQCITLPVRKIINYEISGTTPTTAGVWLHGYRRLGTNI